MLGQANREARSESMLIKKFWSLSLLLMSAAISAARSKRSVRVATGVDILVIDDGSLDATAQEAGQAGGMVVSLPFNLGIGAAVQTGFQYAQKHHYDIAVQIDGDGQHDAAYLGKNHRAHCP